MDSLATFCDAVTPSNASTRDEQIMALFSARYPRIIHFLETFRVLLCVGGVMRGRDRAASGVVVPPLLPKLRERFYSIWSSPCDNPSLVSISVGVVYTMTSEGTCRTRGELSRCNCALVLGTIHGLFLHLMDNPIVLSLLARRLRSRIEEFLGFRLMASHSSHSESFKRNSHDAGLLTIFDAGTGKPERVSSFLLHFAQVCLILLTFAWGICLCLNLLKFA